MKQIRDHYDRTGVGVVLIGMPGIEKSLARYPQLYSRVGFVHHYRPLSLNEQHLVLARHWPRLALEDLGDFTTAETVATITRITSGNFRLTSRLVAQVERVMDINQLKTVTAEVVETARESKAGSPPTSATRGTTRPVQRQQPQRGLVQDRADRRRPGGDHGAAGPRRQLRAADRQDAAEAPDRRRRDADLSLVAQRPWLQGKLGVMAGMRREFGAEFREGAVRTAAETGKPIAQLAKALGINETTLAGWVSRAGGAG